MVKGKPIDYSADELEFIRSVGQWPRNEAHAAFCQRFARSDVSRGAFVSLCKRKGWLTGRTGCFVPGQESHNKGKKCEPGRGGLHPNARKSHFKKGKLPHNVNYLGHERIDPKDGYVYISVNERNPHTGFERRYVLKHKWRWVQLNGPVPKGHALKCLDGDKTNTDPANWELIPRAILPRLNGGRRKALVAFDEAAPELRPTILAIAKLEHAARKTSV